MPIGSRWEVIGVNNQFLRLSTKDTPLAFYHEVIVFAYKFAPLAEFAEDKPGGMEDGYSQYEEAIRAQEIIHGT